MNTLKPMDQGAQFQIEGPDEDGCVWAVSRAGREGWCKNLGPVGDVEIVLRDWLWTLERDWDELPA